MASSSTLPFDVLPNRDAYATQRGYLYQALLSVQAWVELRDSDLLELEAGEDIDWIHLAESSSRREADRTLGQVKFRRRRLSLRSPEALESILNYWRHLQRNQAVRLHFRLISNAKPASERNLAHSSGIPGIDLWSSLSTPLPEDELSERLAHIRNVLRSSTKPAEANILEWDSFRRFLEQSSDFGPINLCQRVQVDAPVR